jgi:hypothetical protein
VPAPPPPKTSSAVPIVVIVVVVIFGGIFVLGIVAAIAIPALLRARVSANEAAAIGKVRSVVSAEVTWASSHGGRFAEPACLVDPASCGEPQTPGILMIDSLEPRSGYDFGFVLRPGADEAAMDAAGPTATRGTPGVSPPGAPTDAEVRAQLEQFSTPDTGAVPPPMARPQPTAPSDPGGFACWASPSNPGVTGNRHFCVDETGVVRAYGPEVAWTAPSGDQPRCPDTGRPLQ